MSDKKNLKTPGCKNPAVENRYAANKLHRSHEKRLIAGLISAVSLFLFGLCGMNYKNIPLWLK